MPGGGSDTYGSAVGPELDVSQEEKGRWQRIWDWIKDNLDFNAGLLPSEGIFPESSERGGSTVTPPAGESSTGGAPAFPGLPPWMTIPPEYLPQGPGGPSGPTSPGGGPPMPPPGPQPPMAPPGPQGGIPRPGGGGGPRPPQQQGPPPWQWQWQGPQQPWQGPSQTVYRGGGPTPPPPWRLF
jgi:hypothetical protein